MGIFSIAALPEIAALLPWLAGIFVVVLGFGLLSRGRSDTKREKAESERRRAGASNTVHRSSPAREPSFERTSEGHSNRHESATSTSSRKSSSSRAASRSTSSAESRSETRDRRRSAAAATSRTAGSSWNPFKGKKRLKRSMSDKRIMGVCSGIARYLGLDVTLVRVAFVVGLLVTGGQFAFAYIALGWAMPKDTDLSDEERMRIIRDS
jgi:phage shock protein PspC (stress-responsive transcriptional regulator)